MASLPFVAVAWGILLLGAVGPGAVGRAAVAAVSALMGLLPYLYKLLLHRPFDQDHVPADRTLDRLTRIDFRPTRLFDLFYPELPWALHVRDVVRWLPEQVAGRLELLWVGTVWFGLLVSVYVGLRAWRRRAPGQRRRVPVALVPGLFVLLFAGAYATLDTGLEILPTAFTNVREPGHRMLPPLLASLLVGSGVGWARLAAAAPKAKPLLLVFGLIPAVIGGVSQSSLVQGAAPGGLSAYRGVCGDILGFNAAASLRGSAVAALDTCRGIGDPALERDCEVGASWGAGFHGAKVGSLPPAAAPSGWSPSAPALTVETRALCDGLEPGPRERCLFGLGWFTGMLHWGREAWPLPCCDSLPTAHDQDACWRGVGFPVGDHLSPSPWKVREVMERVPPSRRDEVAWGIGVAIGRTWSSREHAEWLCGQTGMDQVEACVDGVRSRH